MVSLSLKKCSKISFSKQVDCSLTTVFSGANSSRHFWEESPRWSTVPHHIYSRWRFYPSVLTMKLWILRLCPRGAMLWIKEALLSFVNLSVSGFNNMLHLARGERHTRQCASFVWPLSFTATLPSRYCPCTVFPRLRAISRTQNFYILV